jgi:hypothetical protein
VPVLRHICYCGLCECVSAGPGSALSIPILVEIDGDGDGDGGTRQPNLVKTRRARLERLAFLRARFCFVPKVRLEK